MILLGLASIPRLGLLFSAQAATLVLLGGIVLTASFLLHLQLSRESSIAEKIYAILISAAILLIVSAAVAYMVVHVDYVAYETSGGTTGPYAGQSMYVLIPVVHHIYEEHAAVLVLLAISLALNALYIKSRMP